DRRAPAASRDPTVAPVVRPGGRAHRSRRTHRRPHPVVGRRATRPARGIETGPRVPADRAWGRPVRGHRASPLAGRDPMAGARLLTPAPDGRSGTVSGMTDD